MPDTGVPLVASKHSRQNAQLVRIARERGITPVTPN
jgi:type III secretory pathway component EscU